VTDMSTEEILSEEEKDALMDGVASGEVGSAAAAPPGEAVPYDITGQDRIERGRLPVLDVINERFVRYFRESLNGMFQREVEVTAGDLTTVRFGEYVHGQKIPASLNLVQIEPLPGTALFIFDNTLVFTFVDLFFGGGGSHTEADEDRELTVIENRVVQLVLDQVFKDMQRAWESVLSLECKYLKSESNPRFANIASSKESIIVNSFQLALEGITGEFQIGMPVTMLEPVRNFLNSGIQMSQQGNKAERLQGLRDKLQEAEIELNGICARTTLTLGDVFSLKAGDVIPVEMPELVMLQVDDVPVCYGRFGVHKGRNAVQVVDLEKKTG